MHHLIRLVFAFVLLLLAEAGARAEYPPSQDPQLRIETGMHTAGIWRLGVSADGKLLVTSSEDKTIRLWSTDDGRFLRIFRVPIAAGGEGKVTLFMDACNAGAGIQGGVSKIDMDGLVNNLSDGASIVMFASSTGREVSYEGPQWENGAFTEALLSILSDPNAYGADGKLSISEIDEELTTRVETLTDGKQTPVMTKPGAVKRFFLAAL